MMAIADFTGLPRQIAKAVAPTSLQDEAEAAGWEGLASAAQSFDPELGYNAKRWAHLCVRRAVIQLLRSWSWLPRRVVRELGDEAALMATPVEMTDDVMPIDEWDAESAYLAAETTASLRAAMAALPSGEASLLDSMYFGGETLDVAGARLGWSKSWACRVHARAIERMRHRVVSEIAA